MCSKCDSGQTGGGLPGWEGVQLDSGEHCHVDVEQEENTKYKKNDFREEEKYD